MAPSLMQSPRRNLHAPRALLRNSAKILRRIERAPHILLFLDFDGTLTPLRRHPDQVRLALSTQSLLRRLAQHPRLTLFIVSGRSLRDLKRRVRVPRVRCLGLHGWEGLAGHRVDRASRQALMHLRAEVAERILPIRGMRLEDKRDAVAIHYRGASPTAVRQARRRLLELIDLFRAHLRLVEGKKVWEVLPRVLLGKGAAVQKLAREYPRRSLVIYIGDDTTDEDAFRVLPQAITVRVGKVRSTQARWYARNPAETLRFLELLGVKLR